MLILFAKRGKSTLIPPKISSMAELGRLKSSLPQAHPELFNRMKLIYKNLPKGQAKQVAPNGFVSWYYQKYMETNSLAPLWHFLGVMIPVGYYVAYFKGGHYHPRYEFH